MIGLGVAIVAFAASVIFAWEADKASSEVPENTINLLGWLALAIASFIMAGIAAAGAVASL